jgi:hypothetical protein
MGISTKILEEKGRGLVFLKNLLNAQMGIKTRDKMINSFQKLHNIYVYKLIVLYIIYL